MNPQITQSWLDAFRLFVGLHLPSNLPAGAQQLALCGLVAVVGLLFVFASVRLARPLVTLVGFLVGAFLGLAFATDLGVSQPLAAVVAGVILAWTAFRTHRFWLLLATVVVVVGAVLVAQLDQTSIDQLARYDFSRLTEIAQPAAPDTQLRLIPADWQEQLKQTWERVRDHCMQLGVRGSILPIVAAIVAIVIAIRAARALASVWLTLAGVLATTAAVLTGVSAQWPQYRANVVGHPEWVLGSMAGLWGLGLLVQARGAMRARAANAPPPAKPAKS